MKIEVEDLKKINMAPDDTLVVRCKMGMPPTILEAFSNVFKKIFPNNKLMIIPETIEIYKLISKEDNDG